LGREIVVFGFEHAEDLDGFIDRGDGDAGDATGAVEVVEEEEIFIEFGGFDGAADFEVACAFGA
jgi:hypothetical protein